MSKKPSRRAATRKHAAKHKHAKPSTALVRRPAAAPARRPAPVATLVKETRDLSELIQLGELGLVEVKLTKEEELVLGEEVPIADIQVKPTAHPTPYLSHPGYTRWLNRAFGRLGWSIVPASKPMRSESSVVCPYILYIHGKPAAFAMGEQEYHEGNKDQSYGDALEATVASALRRCAKRLGVGLQLWDRGWLEAFIREHCVCVTVTTRSGEQKKQWRRKTDRPFFNEVGRGTRQDEPRTEARTTDARAAHHPQSAQPITDGQQRRLWVILRKSGRDQERFKDWLLLRYKIDSTKKITRDIYDTICTAVEAPGDLPMPEGWQEGVTS